MTHDVNAAIRGARAAGATQVVVKDSHGSMKNLLIDQLEEGTELVSGTGSGTDGMMQGIDSSFDAAILVGYHGMAGTQAGIMEHTYTGGCHRLMVNGRPAGEIALSVGTAGRYGVPIVAVTSDEAGCAEAADLITGVCTYTTKFGFGRYMGRLLHPSETGKGIEETARRAVASSQSIAPLVIEAPVRITIEYNRSEDADICSTLVGVSRLDAFKCEAVFDDYASAQQGTVNMLELGGLGSNANR